MTQNVSRYVLNRLLIVTARACSFSIAAGIPTITSLWAERGMERGQFYLLEIFFAVALMSLEVITGRFADRFGKIRAMKLGFATQAAGSLVYAFAGSFHEFLIGEVLFALGLALVSGTDEALMFQSNKALGQQGRQQTWWNWAVGLGFVSMGMFSIIGAAVATIDLRLPFLLSAGVGFLSAVLCFFMQEPPNDDEGDDSPAGGSLKEAITSVLCSSAALRWMIVAPGLVVSINQPYLFIYAEYFKDCNITTAMSGYIFAVFNLVAGCSALGLRKIEDDKTGILMVFILLLAIASSTLGLLSVVGVLAWLVIIPQQMVRSVSGALFSQTINEAIPDHVRVTALSVRNAVRVIVYVAALTPWWLGIDSLGRNGMLQVSLMIVAVSATVLWITAPKSRGA